MLQYQVYSQIIKGDINGITFTIYPTQEKGWYKVVTANTALTSSIVRDSVNKTISRERLNKWAKQAKQKRAKSFRGVRVEAKNLSESRYHKTKMKARPCVNCDYEYIEASREIYGNAIEMNRKTVSMTEKVSRYLDGAQPENSQHVYRPLTTSFPTYPEKSHK